MKIKLFNSDWLWFGVLLSILPLGLVLILYTISGHEVGQAEYVPDLILVSFAIAVNLLGSINSSKLKNENSRKAYARFSTLSILICLASYFFLVGVAINLSEGLIKIETLIEDNPESYEEVYKEIKDILSGKINTTPWILYTIFACLFGIINASLGLSIEKKEEEIKTEDYEQLGEEIRQFLKGIKVEMNSEDYIEVVKNLKKSLSEQQVLVKQKQLICIDENTMDSQKSSNIIKKEEESINGKP